MGLIDDVKARYKQLSFQTTLLNDVTTDIVKKIYRYISEYGLFSNDEMCAYFCVSKNSRYILYYDIGRTFFDAASVCCVDLSREECVFARNNALLLLQKYIGTDLPLTKDDASCLKVLYPLIDDKFENFDGSGFPTGKRGDMISLAGRVLSVSEFVAKAILGCVRKELLLQQLEELSGKVFDPAVIDIIKQIIDDVYKELFDIFELSDEEKKIQLEYSEIRDTISDVADSCLVELQLIDDKLNVISRAAYTAVAEKTNRIFPITKLMFEEACENMALLRFSDSAIVRKFILPISVGCLNKKLFVQYVRRMMNKYKINPENFIFAVTETVLGYGDPTVVESLQEFKRAGIKIAIDNFGSEFSSLSRLDSFDFDILIIDRQFIEQIHLNKKAYELVKGMLSIAESLELDVVADGVDSAAQKEVLSELGCRYMQGAYFGGRHLLEIEFMSEGETN